MMCGGKIDPCVIKLVCDAVLFLLAHRIECAGPDCLSNACVFIFDQDDGIVCFNDEVHIAQNAELTLMIDLVKLIGCISFHNSASFLSPSASSAKSIFRPSFFTT